MIDSCLKIDRSEYSGRSHVGTSGIEAVRTAMSRTRIVQFQTCMVRFVRIALLPVVGVAVAVTLWFPEPTSTPVTSEKLALASLPFGVPTALQKTKVVLLVG